MYTYKLITMTWITIKDIHANLFCKRKLPCADLEGGGIAKPPPPFENSIIYASDPHLSAKIFLEATVLP